MEALWAMRVLLWCATGTMALVATTLRRREAGRDTRHDAMLLWGGLLTIILAFDEAARLHEVVLPGALGVSEHFICSVYAAWAMGWLVRFRDVIVPPTSGWILASIFCFAFAIVIEQVGQSVAGEALKLAGVACWGAFFARCSLRRLRANVIRGQLLSLSQQDLAQATKEIDATAATMAELAAMAKEAAARRAEMQRCSAPPPVLSDALPSESSR